MASASRRYNASMRDRMYSLAIETSGPVGSVTLGRADEPLETVELPPQRRHRVDLMPAIDELMRRHGAAPIGLAELYVSIGPGSFTGLRIAAATVKMLAQVLGVQVATVPTLDVLAGNVPAPERGEALAVCLNMKGPTVYTGVFRRQNERWELDGPPALCTMAQLLSVAPRPLQLLGDPIPAFPAEDEVTALPANRAVPRSNVVWRLGREMAGRNEFVDPIALLPLYARRPEAEELWEKNRRQRERKAPSATKSS